jgi:hypothetical protein
MLQQLGCFITHGYMVFGELIRRACVWGNTAKNCQFSQILKITRLGFNLINGCSYWRHATERHECVLRSDLCQMKDNNRVKTASRYVWDVNAPNFCLRHAAVFSGHYSYYFVDFVAELNNLCRDVVAICWLATFLLLLLQETTAVKHPKVQFWEAR